MNSFDLLIARALAPYTGCRRVDGRLMIATQCLYPGGDSVLVVVSDGKAGYLVSDDGAGWRALLEAGVEPSPSSHGGKAEAIARMMGVELSRGSFVADGVSEAQLGAAIVLVANASQRWVIDILRERHQRVERDLRKHVSDALSKLFAKDQIVSHARLSGATSKTYEFANVVDLSMRRLIVEPVPNHPSAIASSFLKLTDVHNAHPDYAREVIIEGQDDWKSEDLAVLSEASDGVRDIARGLEPLREKYPQAA